MKSEIIAVGSELLLGQITNTNATYLSTELALMGIDVFFHTVVGDNKERLEAVVKKAQERSDLIIVSGGLGPTKDDLTKETIANLLGKQLVYDEASLKKIEDYFIKVGRKMTENNKKQALIIEGAIALKNDTGMAPGIAIKEKEITYILLPGPPSEIMPMFENYAKAYIQNLLDVKEHIRSRVLRFYGIGESALETKLIDLFETQSNPTIAPLVNDDEVTVRITAKHLSLEQIESLINETEKKILSRVGKYFYGYDDTTLAMETFLKLKEKKLTIASAESLTGGFFAKTLTDFSGASEVFIGSAVTYTNDIKKNILHVTSETLETYGAVSEECALEMAVKVKELFNSNIGISFTGVAGPDKSEDKDVGTVFIGIATDMEAPKTYALKLAGSREAIRKRTVKFGLYYLSRINGQ